MFYNYIEKELDRTRRHNYKVAFLIIDVNNFKTINDRYGHKVGDFILKGIGKILIEQTRKIDTVVRYCVDEFLIVLPAFARNHIKAFKERLNKAISEWKYKDEISNFDADLSIGIAYWDPKEERSLEEAINEANFLMYEEKKTKYKRKV
ncbi:MAG: GGDEF domain-containing protein [Actinobacteria bacterium]|nr:GGDEF domain-containing protein [Actinomycetota bacterium]